MKGFYVALAVVCLVGGGWLVYAARQKPAERQGPVTPVPVATDGFTGYTFGSESAPVTIVEYSDFECPYCAAFVTVQMPAVREQLIATGKVRLRFRDFPLSSHEYSRYAALAAQCAGEQGKFWEMHDQLFYHHEWAQTRKNPSGLFRDFAKQIGVDGNRYDACMDSQRYAGRIEASRLEGEAAGINGTPGFVINGRRFVGRPTSDALKAVVDSLTSASKR
jgi:protein-disulfide isomerase